MDDEKEETVQFKELNKKIEKLEEEFKNIAIEKTSLEGSLDRIFDQIKTLSEKVEEIKRDVNKYKEENKKDLKSIGDDIKSLHDCMTIEKISNAKNSTIISVVLPIIILAIAFFLGIK